MDFSEIVQIIGLVTAVPVIMGLIAPILAGAACYRPTRLHRTMLLLLRRDMRVLLAAPELLRVDEEDLAASALMIIEKRLHAQKDSFTLVEFARLEQATIDFLSHQNPTVATVIATGRRAEGRSATLRFLRWLATVDLRKEARWGSWRIRIEIARVSLAGLRDIGFPVALRILQKAGEDVTQGSVIGLIVAVVFWQFAGPDESFFGYIGNGVTLGAFLGLALTCVRAIGAFARPWYVEIQSQERWSRRSSAAIAVILMTIGLIAWPIWVIHISRP